MYVTEEVTPEYLAALDIHRGAGRRDRVAKEPLQPTAKSAELDILTPTSIGLTLSASSEEFRGVISSLSADIIVPPLPAAQLYQPPLSPYRNGSGKSGICEILHNNSSRG